jgi:hypothetical protein
MPKQLVYVEVNAQTELPIRILRTTKEAYELDPKVLRQMAKSVAVKYIRDQIVDRARRGNLILCEFCGQVINEFVGELHEQLPRGQGGEISLANSVFLCHECHTGKTGEHGDRYWGGRNEV